MTEFRFDVAVPVEAVLHESPDSSSTYELPTGRFGRFDVTPDEQLFVVRLVCVSPSPIEAMRLGLTEVQDLLRVLAAANDAFRVRASSISVVNLGVVAGSAERPISEAGTVDANETLFLHGHLGTRKLKGSLESEALVTDTRDQWPPYLRDALELNYMAVTSERPQIRWLLETIALERLAVGRLGARSRLVTDQLDPPDRSVLAKSLTKVFETAGFTQPQVARLVQRVVTAEAESAPGHIVKYLESMGVEVDPREVSEWWARRGRQAHGSVDTVDASALSRLVSRTQAALALELHPSA